MINKKFRSLGTPFVTVLFFFICNVSTQAQETPGQNGPADNSTSLTGEGRAGGSGGTIGGNYIDLAIPLNTFRLRFEATDGGNVPNRAEFLYAQYHQQIGDNGGPELYVWDPNGKVFRETDKPGLITNNADLAKSNPNIYRFVYQGRGLPEVESNINTREYSMYGEYVLAPRFSVFAELPIFAIQPEFNSNASGIGDLQVGFKYAFIYQPEKVVSFQFRTYVPTGDPLLGLGTGHVSAEPALLYWQQLTPRNVVFGEFRGWIPIGGSNQAGNVLRYGLGTSYLAYQNSHWWVAPVAEVVGWTVLSGQETIAVTPDIFDVRDARGDTIVNAKVGLRFGVGERSQFAISYSRALTGDVWYKDMLRVEYKWSF